MMRERTASLLLVVAAAACGKGSGGSRGPAEWMAAKWVDVQGDLKGISFTAQVPEGLPENTEYMLGKDWWVNTGRDIQEIVGGPRLTLTRKSESYADVDAFVKTVEDDPTRSDLVEVAKEKQADGRLRWVHTTLGGSHLDVSVWIPFSADEGLECTAHYWGGMDSRGEAVVVEPRDQVAAWLDRFCASVKLAPR